MRRVILFVTALAVVSCGNSTPEATVAELDETPVATAEPTPARPTVQSTPAPTTTPEPTQQPSPAATPDPRDALVGLELTPEGRPTHLTPEELEHGILVDFDLYPSQVDGEGRTVFDPRQLALTETAACTGIYPEPAFDIHGTYGYDMETGELTCLKLAVNSGNDAQACADDGGRIVDIADVEFLKVASDGTGEQLTLGFGCKYLVGGFDATPFHD